MSAPFGGHPTLGQYLVWATSAGCTVEQGIVLDPDSGKPYSNTRITAPSGKWVHVVGTQHGEYLVPTMIAHFDGRLGLKSPFFSL